MKIFTNILVVIIFESCNLYSQVFDVKAGLNLANVVLKSGGESQLHDYIQSINAGLSIDFPINQEFRYGVGIFFSGKGFFKDETMMHNDTVFRLKQQANLYYLEIPFTAKWYADTGSVKIFVSGGFVFGIGILGSSSKDGSVNDSIYHSTNDIYFDNGKNDAKLWDYGLILGVGIEYGNFSFGINYNYGIANISNERISYSLNNRVISFLVGYKFYNPLCE